MNALIIYLAVGMWTYIVMSMARLNMFRSKGRYTTKGLIKGFVFAALLWPTAPVIMYVLDKNELKAKALKRQEQRIAKAFRAKLRKPSKEHLEHDKPKVSRQSDR